MEDSASTPLASSANRSEFIEDFSQVAHTTGATELDQREEATIEAIASRIPRLRDPEDPQRLTPLRAHYLKKTLVKLQIDKELNTLSRQGMYFFFHSVVLSETTCRCTFSLRTAIQALSPHAKCFTTIFPLFVPSLYFDLPLPEIRSE